ncbi:hypothetical protein J3458_019336 [Metarhizium acridum]|uniref:uncharacterized protein n=1 Tax=Metarhizium acridum TaxID=92637 RepID=UPI001C6B5594|nr:hypothetical protein J3458_019336 [Metarhizium acridum]
MALFGAAQSRVDDERNHFVEAIGNRENDIRQLATAHHPNALPCELFRLPGSRGFMARGTFNICFFVQFPTGERWVVRIPLRPCLAVSARSKLESEIATMSSAPSVCPCVSLGILTGVRLVTERTTIPIPQIVGYSLAETCDPLSTYIIMEYVEGGTLSMDRLRSATATQRDNLYKSLAKVYTQLRRLEFPAIGRLGQCTDGFEVCRRALTIDMNGLQIEGLDPFSTQASYHDKNDSLVSANDYIAMRLQISWNAFLKGRNSIEQGMAANVLYHLQLFCKHVEKWKDPALDRGPFVLTHGDLGPQNLIVDDTLEIKAVIDWEWSRVVPVQLFTPPLWLTCRDTPYVTAPNSYKLYLKKALLNFLEAVRTQELSTFGEDRLFEEWTSRKDNAEPLVANALENWTDIDWFAYLYLSKGDDAKLEEDVRSFIEADPIRGLITRMKEDDTIAYMEEMQQLEDIKARSAMPGNRVTISRLADWMSSEHMKLWTMQSLPLFAGAGIVFVGGLLVGRKLEAIPRLVAGLSLSVSRLVSGSAP